MIEFGDLLNAVRLHVEGRVDVDNACTRAMRYAGCGGAAQVMDCVHHGNGTAAAPRCRACAQSEPYEAFQLAAGHKDEYYNIDEQLGEQCALPFTYRGISYADGRLRCCCCALGHQPLLSRKLAVERVGIARLQHRERLGIDHVDAAATRPLAAWEGV